mmetsp:Transcript_15768/g.23754  ORF Transcript_15768/g.23754 Transcript_15768/m.23754 type:complete len:237 (-) Transcript_15768:53-763(-)
MIIQCIIKTIMNMRARNVGLRGEPHQNKFQGHKFIHVEINDPVTPLGMHSHLVEEVMETVGEEEVFILIGIEIEAQLIHHQIGNMLMLLAHHMDKVNLMGNLTEGGVEDAVVVTEGAEVGVEVLVVEEEEEMVGADLDGREEIDHHIPNVAIPVEMIEEVTTAKRTIKIGPVDFEEDIVEITSAIATVIVIVVDTVKIEDTQEMKRKIVAEGTRIGLVATAKFNVTCHNAGYSERA